MGKINITDIREALTSGHCFKSITDLCFDQGSSNYYTTKHYAVFEVDIHREPYLMLVLFDPKAPLNDTLIQNIRLAGRYAGDILFGKCMYLPEELHLMDYAESLCDLVFIHREEGGHIRSRIYPEDSVKALLNRTGELVCRLDETRIVITGDLFSHIIVNKEGVPVIQISPKITLIAPEKVKPKERLFFHRMLALNLLFLWCKALNISVEKDDMEFSMYAMQREIEFDRLYDMLMRYCNQIQAIYSVNLEAFVKTIVTGEFKRSRLLIKELEQKRNEIHIDSCPLRLGGDPLQRKTGMVDYLNNEHYTISMVHREDRIAIMKNETGLWGFIDYYGTLIIDFKYHAVNDFDEGYAIVVMNEHAGVINRFGETVLPIEFDDIEWNSYDNVFHVSQQGEHYLLDREGTRITEKTYRSIGIFYRSLAVVESHQGRKGYISNTGRVIVPPVYIDATPFKEDFALVQTEDGNWHRIGQSGEKID